MPVVAAAKTQQRQSTTAGDACVQLSYEMRDVDDGCALSIGEERHDGQAGGCRRNHT